MKQGKKKVTMGQFFFFFPQLGLDRLQRGLSSEVYGGERTLEAARE